MITTDLFEETMSKNPHLGQYIKRYEQESGLTPDFHEQLTYDMRYIKIPNIIYPVGDPIFVHVYKETASSDVKYVAVEPLLNEEQDGKRKKIVEWIYDKVPEVDLKKNLT